MFKKWMAMILSQKNYDEFERQLKNYVEEQIEKSKKLSIEQQDWNYEKEKLENHLWSEFVNNNELLEELQEELICANDKEQEEKERKLEGITYANRISKLDLKDLEFLNELFDKSKGLI